MAGLMFVVCVPTSDYERGMSEKCSRKSFSSDTDIQIHNSDSHSKHSVPSSENIQVRQNEENKHYCQYEVGRLPASAENKCEENSENITIVNESEVRDTKIDMHGEHEELSRIVVRKGTTERTKIPFSEGEFPMEKVLAKLLKMLKINNAVWCAGESGEYYQVLFSVGSGDRCEEILRHFSESGIGIKLNSVVSVIPCTLYYQGKEQQLQPNDSPSSAGTQQDRRLSSKISAWDKFVLSVRARLTVAQVVEGVKAAADLTFDFFVLLLISGFIAALGLVEDSTVILVASMLISPLMGPVMAGTFGTVIGDRHLQKIGVLNELFGLLVCIVVGYVFGLGAGLANEHWGNAGWPTEEMMSRGLIRSLWVGVLLALASGAAVAIAILGNNTGSLVGVAISASLMPPAVNAGLLWALACMDLMWTGRMQLENEDGDPNNTATYTPIYSDQTSVELAVLGAVSLCLTIINIVCIFLAGILVLKIKEVAPRTSRDQEQFWKHDIKVARDYNRTFSGSEANDLRNRLAENLACSELQNQFQALSRHRQLFSPAAFNMQQTWSPSTTNFLCDNRPTLKDLEEIYTLGSAKYQSNDNLKSQSRRRRHSGGTTSWPRVSVTSSMSTSCNTLSGLAPISEGMLPCQSDSNASTVSSEFNDVSRKTQGNGNGKSRFIVTPAPDPVLNK